MEHLYLDKSFTLYEDILGKEWILLGVPFDSTETYLPGQRLAPNKIREIIFNKDTPRFFDDMGNVVPIHGNVQATLKRIEEVVKEVKHKKIFALGGEHTITYGVIKGILSNHRTLQFIYFDAHYDMKLNPFIEVSHDSFARKLSKNKQIKIFPIGVRRYDEEEKEYAMKNIESFNNLKTHPTYISIDMDYFDIPYALGCADKESEGYTPKDFKDTFTDIIYKVGKENIVGIDIVEVNPLIDSSLVTTTLAADLIIWILNVLEG